MPGAAENNDCSLRQPPEGEMSTFKAVNAVRKRQSYKFFMELMRWIRDKKPTPQAIADRVHFIINNHSGYGSRTNAEYACESMRLAIDDFGTEVLHAAINRDEHKAE